MASDNLAKIFQPKSVAIIGATSRPCSVGRTVLENMMRAEFGGAIYPVNLKRIEVLEPLRTLEAAGPDLAREADEAANR